MSLSPWIRRHRLDLIIVACIVALGLYRTLAIDRFGFDIGDNSTFLAFARNIAGGQAIYKDFIHFRMPGYYFVNALFMTLFTPNFATLHLATGIDFIVAYTATFYISVRILTRSVAIAVISSALVLVFPEILQMRSGFGLLAVALYAYSLRSKSRGRWLFLSGVTLGFNFLYGQEVAIMAAAAILASEAYFERANLRELARRVGLLLAGGLLIVVPLALYMIVYSNFFNFIYYAFYYALIVQPRHMNLPYPSLGSQNWQYYLPLGVYLLSFLAFSIARRFGRVQALVLSFGVLRMISAMGRADMSHLMFSVPEMFFIAPWAIVELLASKRPYSGWKTVGVVVLALVMGLALVKGSIYLLLAALLLPLFCEAEPEKQPLPRLRSALSSVVIVGLFAAAFWPQLWQLSLQPLRHDLRSTPRNLISGVETDPQTYGEVTAVSSIITAAHPSKIFSYPIQPFYYTILPPSAHAARFMTFESETTVKEQQETIADLEKNRPQLIVMDDGQADAMSGVLYLVHNYVTSNYTVVQQVNRIDHIYILKPKTVPSFEEHLLYNLYHYNAKGSVRDYHLQVDQTDFADALEQKGATATFKLDLSGSTVFTTQLMPLPGKTDRVCGSVDFFAGNIQKSQQICSTDGSVRIDVSRFSGQTVTIVLHQNGLEPLLWMDPTVHAQ